MLKTHFATFFVSKMGGRLETILSYSSNPIFPPQVSTFVAERYMRNILCNSKRFNPRQITPPLIIVW